MESPEAYKIAENVRRACIEAARAAYEDAGFAGMCEDGRWERALDAISSLDLESMVPGDGAPPAEQPPPASDEH